jgi:hypothetical protein
VTGSGTSSSPASSSGCTPSGSRTLSADRRARVFDLSGVVYGCATRVGRRYRLGEARSCVGSDRAGPFALAGEIVAYGLERCGIDTGFSQVVVENLATGKRTRSESATTSPLGPESYVSVSSVAVKSNGAVGWIDTGGSIVAHRQIREVHRADKAGRALLDSGLAIGSSSLRLSGSRLTWKHGKSTRSAPLS